MFKLLRYLAIAGFVAITAVGMHVLAAYADNSSPSANSAQSPPAMATKLYQNEMDSITQRDYAKFVKYGTPAFQTGLTKQQFDSLCDQLTDTLKDGYTSAFVTEAPYQGDNVCVWRLTLNGGTKILAQLAAKQGKIDGFFLKPDTL